MDALDIEKWKFVSSSTMSELVVPQMMREGGGEKGENSSREIDFSEQKPATPLLDTINFPIHMKNLTAQVTTILKVTRLRENMIFAAHDSVVELGGPTWKVQLGRRDSKTANKIAANNDIPPPTSNLSSLISRFSSKGLSAKDLVALSGAHTIGVARCTGFQSRIYIIRTTLCKCIIRCQHEITWKGVEINIWDLDNCSKIWTAKSPPSNSLGIFTPTWFTAATFLSKDHRKIVAGTNQHQVRLYDISAQRRPVISFDFRESPIKVITEDLDGHTVYVGNASGDLGSFDMRTGKLLGCFLGKCCGSIRSIVRHPELPIIASCGLDSYLRFWDINTRKPLSVVFLKQHLTSAVVDANFADNGTATAKDDDASRAQVVEHKEVDSEEPLPLRRRKRREEHEQTGKIKSRKSKRVPDYENNTSQIKTIKSKKSKKVRDYDNDTLVSCES